MTLVFMNLDLLGWLAQSFCTSLSSSTDDESTTLITGVVLADTNNGFEGDFITDSLRAIAFSTFSTFIVVVVVSFLFGCLSSICFDGKQSESD